MGFGDLVRAADDDVAVDRAQVAAVRVPTGAQVAAIEKDLAGIAATSVSLSVLSSAELIVTSKGYDSIAGYIQARAIEQLAAGGSGAPAPPPAETEQVPRP